jgi:hypothetical protein
MVDPSANPDAVPCEPDIDADGVDRAQIREMLSLTPVERLLVIQNLADSIAEIRALNGQSSVR